MHFNFKFAIHARRRSRAALLARWGNAGCVPGCLTHHPQVVPAMPCYIGLRARLYEYRDPAHTRSKITYLAMAAVAQQQIDSFRFPKIHTDYPPFFTLQIAASSRQAQLERWSRLIQRYCRHHKIFQLSIVDFQDKDLFKNAKLNKTLYPDDIKKVIDHMVSQDGQQRAEWLTPAKASAWIWWRRPEEWALAIAAWVDDTGQKGSVLTLYEIVEGDATENQEFHGMDMEVLRKGLAVLTKQGKAQVFGTDDQQGVKFF